MALFHAFAVLYRIRMRFAEGTRLAIALCVTFRPAVPAWIPSPAQAISVVDVIGEIADVFLSVNVQNVMASVLLISVVELDKITVHAILILVPRVVVAWTL